MKPMKNATKTIFSKKDNPQKTLLFQKSGPLAASYVL